MENFQVNIGVMNVTPRHFLKLLTKEILLFVIVFQLASLLKMVREQKKNWM